MNIQLVNNMKHFRNFSTCSALFLFLLCSGLHAQQNIQPGAERMELVKIGNLYNRVPYLSYRLQYLYADSSAPAAILDSAYVNCQLMSGKSFFSDSETEVLDDNYKLVYLDKDDSTITVTQAQSHPVLQLPLLDSIFNVVHVSNLSVTNLNDSTRKLTVSFNSWSNYRGYQITYSSRNYFISQIRYYTQNNGDFDLPVGHTVCTTINISNNSIAKIDPAVFNINRYVYLLNGQYYPQPAYQQYQVTTNQ